MPRKTTWRSWKPDPSQVPSNCPKCGSQTKQDRFDNCVIVFCGKYDPDVCAWEIYIPNPLHPSPCDGNEGS